MGTILGMLFGTTIPFRLPLSIDAAMVGIGFFHCARRTKNLKFNIYNCNIYIVILMCIITTILIFFNGYVNMRTSSYAIKILSLFNAVSMTVVGWNISRIIYNYLSKSKLHIVGDVFINIGKNSIVYVCLNQFVILFVMVIIHKITVIKINTSLANVIVLIIAILILHIISYILTNTKLKLFIGK